MHYTHLAKEERYYLWQALKSGKSMRVAAKEIGRNVSTVSRELLVTRGRGDIATNRRMPKAVKGRPVRKKNESLQRHGSRLSRDCALITALSKSLACLLCKG